MKKNKKIIVGNWKMNPETPEEARAIFGGIKRTAAGARNTETVICPPHIFLPLLSKNATPKVQVGAQNAFYEYVGAFTGEVSAHMLKTSGATHVIIGHSERRALGESDEIVNKKVIAALREDLNVILCVGEKARDSEGHYLEFIKQEIVRGLSKVQKRYTFNLLIAYEPVWAIGKSDRDAMSGADMHQMSIYLRKILAELYDAPAAARVPILYGGSVSPFNAEDIVSGGHVDGLLVGRQSLDAKSFGEILRIVDLVRDSKI